MAQCFYKIESISLESMLSVCYSQVYCLLRSSLQQDIYKKCLEEAGIESPKFITYPVLHSIKSYTHNELYDIIKNGENVPNSLVKSISAITTALSLHCTSLTITCANLIGANSTCKLIASILNYSLFICHKFSQINTAINSVESNKLIIIMNMFIFPSEYTTLYNAIRFDRQAKFIFICLRDEHESFFSHPAIFNTYIYSINVDYWQLEVNCEFSSSMGKFMDLFNTFKPILPESKDYADSIKCIGELIEQNEVSNSSYFDQVATTMDVLSSLVTKMSDLKHSFKDNSINKYQEELTAFEGRIQLEHQHGISLRFLLKFNSDDSNILTSVSYASFSVHSAFANGWALCMNDIDLSKINGKNTLTIQSNI